MKTLNKEELKQQLERVLNGEISLKNLAKELETDLRTLQNSIQVLSIEDPEFYAKYIEKKPYKQKECTNINFEALITDMAKSSLKQSEAAKKYGISVRTISRRIKEIEKTNPGLIDTYMEVLSNKRKWKENSPELQNKVDNLPSEQVVIGDYNEKRRKELLEVEKQFNENVTKYGSKEAAAKSMGKGKASILKSLNELYRLEIERKTQLERKYKEIKNEKEIEVDG